MSNVSNLKTMPRGLSPYKFKRIAEASLINALRLHGDSITLFQAKSFPSAFLLSVLALEEFSKAKWVDHYYNSYVTNEGFPVSNFEQEWLALLYSHPKKQLNFVARDLFDFSPKFVKFITNKNLERKKQQAVYVGLDRVGKYIDTASRISVPTRIKEGDAKQLISLVNQEFVDVFNLISRNETYFGIEELDMVIDPETHSFVFSWPHRSGIKGRRFLKHHVRAFNGSQETPFK